MKTQFRTDNIGTGTGTETPLDHMTTNNETDHLTVHDQETTLTMTTPQLTVSIGHAPETFNKLDMKDKGKSWRTNWNDDHCHEIDHRSSHRSDKRKTVLRDIECILSHQLRHLGDKHLPRVKDLY